MSVGKDSGKSAGRKGNPTWASGRPQDRSKSKAQPRKGFKRRPKR